MESEYAGQAIDLKFHLASDDVSVTACVVYYTYLPVILR